MGQSSWTVDKVDADTVARLAVRHVADETAIELNVDLVPDPHREDDDGNV